MTAARISLLLVTICISCSGIKSCPLDTLKPQDSARLVSGYRHSSLFYFAQLSQSQSITYTSWAFRKISPYTLLWEWQNTTAPDSFFAKYPISTQLRDSLIKEYMDALSASQTSIYHTFKEMADEDQLVRAQLDKCSDTASCRVLGQRMFKTDSVHAQFLRKYLSGHKWPTLAEGSMCATLLAIHDHANHNFYMPFLKDAVAAGQADMGALSLINYYLTQPSDRSGMENDIHSKNAMWFDISEVLAFKLPKNMDHIEKLISQLCGQKFRFYYIYEGPDEAHERIWFNANHADNGIMEQMQTRFKYSCPSVFGYPYVWDVRLYFGFPKETMKMVIVRK